MRSDHRKRTFEILENRHLLSANGPSFEINNGADTTNLRDVSVSLNEIPSGAEQMRFAFNGFNYGQWQAYSSTTNVRIPQYVGTNWVNVEVGFADGTQRMFYDSIIYKNPTLIVNGGVAQTNTRQVTLSFSDLAPDATSVRLAYNGFNYAAPVGISSTMTVTLPSHQGDNYVNAQIVYANQQTRFTWDSIEYVPASVQINAGDAWTDVREVSLSFANVSSDAEQVSFAFNGINYQAPVDFAPTMAVNLPNWEGANYVNAKVHYADGRELWLWDSIEYIPTVVKSCSECVTFELNVQDDPGEGFFDATWGDDRVRAFTHAMGIWSSLLPFKYTGETVTVEASMDSIENEEPGVTTLGGARPNRFSLFNGMVHGDALANHKEGRNIDPAAEVFAEFNSDVDWYYGTDGQANGKNDFVSTVLHELGHGLNFFDGILEDGSWKFSIGSNKLQGIYDSFLVDETGTRLTAMSASERQAAITSDKLFWDGANAKDANNGQRPHIYAPLKYELGSSVSHLDESNHGNEMMSPSADGPDHSPSALELGMLQDMGWTLT